MVNRWLQLEQQVDAAVDERFGEPVVLIPWLSGTGVYTQDQQGPDPSRKLKVTTGIFVTPGARLVGESGRATGGTGGTFNTQMLESEVWLSITDDNLGPINYWRESDRVYFPDRDMMFNVSYVEPSATRRPNVHLIYEHDIITGSGSPQGRVTPSAANTLYFDYELNQVYRSGTTNSSWVSIP